MLFHIGTRPPRYWSSRRAALSLPTSISSSPHPTDHPCLKAPAGNPDSHAPPWVPSHGSAPWYSPALPGLLRSHSPYHRCRTFPRARRSAGFPRSSEGGCSFRRTSPSGWTRFSAQAGWAPCRWRPWRPRCGSLPPRRYGSACGGSPEGDSRRSRWPSCRCALNVLRYPAPSSWWTRSGHPLPARPPGRRMAHPHRSGGPSSRIDAPPRCPRIGISGGR